MSITQDADDLARIIALEHAFGAISLMWACQFAHAEQTKPSEAVRQLRTSVVGALYDDKQYTPGIRNAINHHLERLLGNVAGMADHADQGFQ